jgi:hypothetical protein
MAKPAKKSPPKKAPEPEPPKVKKESKVKLEEPVVAPSAAPVVETPVAAPVATPAPKPRDPELPPLPPREPDPPPHPDRLPFDHKGKRPKSRPCHRCLKDTKLTTNVADVDRDHHPKDGEGVYHEMFDTLIVNVTCAECWRSGCQNW